MAISGVSIRLEGMDTLQRALKETPRSTRKLLGEALKAGAESVSRQAQREAPRDQGDLQRAIQTSGRGLTWRSGVVSSPIASRVVRGNEPEAHINPAIYGTMVHRGTSKMAARPFMRGPAEGEAGHLPSRIRQVAQKIERGAAYSGRGRSTGGGLQ